MKKRIALLLSCFCLTFTCFSTNTQAMERSTQTKNSQSSPFVDAKIKEEGTGEEVSEEFNSVVQIVVCYTTDKGEVVSLAGGSGFLIGDQADSLQNVITSRSNLTVSKKVKQKVAKKYRLQKAEDVQEQLFVVVNKDIMLKASVKAESEELDFAVLQLEQPLHDRNALVFHDQFTEKNLKDDLFVIGYPTANAYGKETVYYAPSQMIKTSGFFENEVKFEGLTYLQHHIFPCTGNIGGPIVDANGNIVAINQANYDGENFYALKISEIMSVLDSFGIPYRTLSDVEAEKEKARLEEEEKKKEEAAKLAELTEIQASKDYLDLTIQRVKRLDFREYKESTVEPLQQALLTAEKCMKKDRLTKEEANEQVRALELATSQLKRKADVRVICSFVGGIVILLSFITIIILKKTSEQRKARKEQKKLDFTVTQPAPVFRDEPIVRETSYKALVDAGNQAVGNREVWKIPTSEDDEATTVLTASADNYDTTSVLQQQQTNAYLVRQATNEKISIYKFPFMIGKDSVKADYYVADNSAVSRVHASIVYENGTYSIQDEKATNGTFVNRERVGSGMRQMLNNQDMISLGNEEFQFLIM